MAQIYSPATVKNGGLQTCSKGRLRKSARQQATKVANDDDGRASDIDAPADEEDRDDEGSEESFCDTDSSGVASADDDISDFDRECAPCEATSAGSIGGTEK